MPSAAGFAAQHRRQYSSPGRHVTLPSARRAWRKALRSSPAIRCGRPVVMTGNPHLIQFLTVWRWTPKRRATSSTE